MQNLGLDYPYKKKTTWAISSSLQTLQYLPTTTNFTELFLFFILAKFQSLKSYSS